MDIQKVIDQALGDPFFAAELAAKAGRASRAQSMRQGSGPTGNEWEDLLAEFAETPAELARMLVGNDPDPDGITTTMTITTLTTTTTVTTAACTITTTTTTTGTTATTTGAVVAPE